MEKGEVTQWNSCSNGSATHVSGSPLKQLNPLQPLVDIVRVLPQQDTAGREVKHHPQLTVASSQCH